MKLNAILIAGASTLMIAACTPPAEETGDLEAETPPAETGSGGADAGDGESDTGSDAETAGTSGDSAAPDGKLAGVDDDTYSLDPTHAFLSFMVMHVGLTEYTVDFTDFDGTIDFNPDDPATSSIDMTINPLGLNVNYPSDFKANHPDSEYDTWPEALSKDNRFLNGDEHPEIRFVSTSVERTGEDTGTVTGDLTFRGQTREVTMDVTYNGMANLPWYGDRDLIGFDAKGTFNRSDFGVTALEGVISDEVTIEFSGEFLQDEAAAEETGTDTDGEN